VPFLRAQPLLNGTAIFGEVSELAKEMQEANQSDRTIWTMSDAVTPVSKAMSANKSSFREVHSRGVQAIRGLTSGVEELHVGLWAAQLPLTHQSQTLLLPLPNHRVSQPGAGGGEEAEEEAVLIRTEARRTAAQPRNDICMILVFHPGLPVFVDFRVD
jgi:hypothetical protein